jgi:hypothetical protein
MKDIFFFFCGGLGLNPRPCIYYALLIPTQLSSRGTMKDICTREFNLNLINIRKRIFIYQTAWEGNISFFPARIDFQNEVKLMIKS